MAILTRGRRIWIGWRPRVHGLSGPLCRSPVCSPSRAAFLTGLHPHQNGQIGLATHKFAMYDANTPNVVTLLKSIGYHTGMIGKLHVNPESAFPLDFHEIRGANFNRKHAVTDYADAASRFFKEAGDKPFFLSVNFPDAHLPFLRQANGRSCETAFGRRREAHVVGRGRFASSAPAGCRLLQLPGPLDEGVGLLLERLEKAGHADETIVFYFGDHGAQFPRGKGSVYEGALRVPLIVRWPGVAKAGGGAERACFDDRCSADRVAGCRDGISRERGCRDGIFDRCWPGEPPGQWREYIFALVTGAFPRACHVQHSIRDARFKLISSPRPATTILLPGLISTQSIFISW
jgi:N-sulfoglucosamine sulfohydrolase